MLAYYHNLFLPHCGREVGSLCDVYCVHFGNSKATKTDLLTVEDEAVSIVSVVVAQSTGRIHVTNVVRVTRVRPTQKPIPCPSYSRSPRLNNKLLYLFLSLDIQPVKSFFSWL